SPSLAKVHFIKCRLQGSEFFFRVLRSLTDLALHACKSITDQEVTCLCSQLRALDLTDSYCLTDKSMKYLAERCTQLTHLTLKRCANITDQGLQCFAQHASLEYLNVLGTKKVTIVGLHRVIGTLPSLTRVVHETLVSATIAVDRDDAEEAEKFILNSQQADLFARRDGAELNYLASTSPRRGGRETVGTGAVTPLAPRPPTASTMTSPKAIQAQQQHQQDDEAVAGKTTSTPSLIAASSISEVAATAAATAPTPTQLQRSPSAAAAAAEEGRQPQADLPELAPGSISAL
ncbi:receptor-type protein kinase, putative, partial [Bodo saltans]